MKWLQQSACSGRNENHVPVHRIIAAADQPDGVGNAPLEFGMRLEHQRHTTAGPGIGSLMLLRVMRFEFFGHKYLSALPDWQQHVQHLWNGWYSTGQSDIHGFDARPKRERGV